MLTYYCNIKMPIIPKTINRSNAMLMLFWQIPIKIPIAFFIKTEKNKLKKFIWNHRRPQTGNAVLSKNRAGGITLTNFKVYYKAHYSKHCGTGKQKQKHMYQWNTIVYIPQSLQSCLTLCDPMDYRLPGSSVHGISQARILEWVAISFSNAWKWKVKVKPLSHVRPSATPWTTAFQAPLSMGFSRQEY